MREGADMKNRKRIPWRAVLALVLAAVIGLSLLLPAFIGWLR